MRDSVRVTQRISRVRGRDGVKVTSSATSGRQFILPHGGNATAYR